VELVDKLEKLDLTHVGESLGDGIAITLELIDRTFGKIMRMGEQAGKTQSTYGAQAFMGMGGMGMGGGGTSLSAATEKAATEQPKTSFFAGILEDIEKKRVEAGKKYATPEPGDTGAGYISKPLSTAMEPIIATSGAKVGALGGAIWGGDNMANVQREQLSVQQKIANSIDAFLQSAMQTSNSYIGDTTPQLGVI
jgi:hypothetical protein